MATRVGREQQLKRRRVRLYCYYPPFRAGSTQVMFINNHGDGEKENGKPLSCNRCTTLNQLFPATVLLLYCRVLSCPVLPQCPLIPCFLPLFLHSFHPWNNPTMPSHPLLVCLFVYLFMRQKSRVGERGAQRKEKKKDALASRKAWLLDRTKLKRESREENK